MESIRDSDEATREMETRLIGWGEGNPWPFDEPEGR